MEGVDLGNGSEFEGHFRARIYLGINWKIDEEEALKTTFRFIVWVVSVNSNVDNKPLNSKRNMGGTVGFIEKIMSSIFNKLNFSTLRFHHYEIYT